MLGLPAVLHMQKDIPALGKAQRAVSGALEELENALQTTLPELKGQQVALDVPCRIACSCPAFPWMIMLPVRHAELGLSGACTLRVSPFGLAL